jgi:hypothetical protein
MWSKARHGSVKQKPALSTVVNLKMRARVLDKMTEAVDSTNVTELRRLLRASAAWSKREASELASDLLARAARLGDEAVVDVLLDHGAARPHGSHE